MSKNPPDKWARAIAVIGIFIGGGGLCLSFFNYRWQKEVYEKNREERIFVQLNAGLIFSGFEKDQHDPAKTQVAVEIVNFGMQPIYIKNVALRIGEEETSFYEYDPMKHDPLPRLESGESASYTQEWRYGQREPLVDAIDKAKGHATVEVDTTRKHFSQEATFTITMTNYNVLMAVAPGVRRSPSHK